MEGFTNTKKLTRQNQQAEEEHKQLSQKIPITIKKENPEKDTKEDIELWKVEQIFTEEKGQPNEVFERWFSEVKKELLKALNLRQHLDQKTKFSCAEIRMVYRVLLLKLTIEKVPDLSQFPGMDIYSGIDYDYWKSSEPSKHNLMKQEIIFK